MDSDYSGIFTTIKSSNNAVTHILTLIFSVKLLIYYIILSDLRFFTLFNEYSPFLKTFMYFNWNLND